MGNLQHESAGWQNDVINSIGAKGLAQWYKGRATRLDQFAAEHGMDWRDVNLQMMYLDYEIKEKGYKWVVEKMQNQSLEDATITWEKGFEISGDTGSYQRRINHAKEIYNRYANGIETAGAYDLSSLGGTSGNKSPTRTTPPPAKPKTHAQEMSDANSFMKRLSLGSYTGKLIDGVFVDKNQKPESLEERKARAAKMWNHTYESLTPKQKDITPKEVKKPDNKTIFSPFQKPSQKTTQPQKPVQPKKPATKSSAEISQDKQESIEAEKTHLQAQIDEERQKLKEVKAEITKNEDLIPKKYFKEAVQLIEKIAKKYMNKVNIESNVDFK